MNLRNLDYIVTIAEEQNISRAAERLFISRPALNHYLIRLEKELGSPLFKRVNKKLIPTYSGSIYIETARQMLELRKSAYKRISDASDEADGCLGLGVTREVGVGLLKDVFPLFNQRFPNYRLDLVEGPARDLEIALEKGRIDIAVMGCRSARDSLVHIPFIQGEVVVVLPPNHRLGHLAAPKGGPYRPIDLRLLEHEKFILICKDTNIRDLCDKHLARANIQPRIMMECSLSTLAYTMVKKGIGVSILMALQVDPKDDVHCFSLRPKEIWTQGVSYRKDSALTKAEEYFIELVKDYFATHSPYIMA